MNETPGVEGEKEVPTKDEWIALHADLVRRLNLPCQLAFSDRGKGRHKHRDGGCFIEVNPNIDWKRPEHLILHEAAHHRHGESECICWGHCIGWAQTLVGMYIDTGIALPEGTQFESFAKVARIIHREHKDV